MHAALHEHDEYFRLGDEEGEDPRNHVKVLQVLPTADIAYSALGYLSEAPSFYGRALTCHPGSAEAYMALALPREGAWSAIPNLKPFERVMWGARDDPAALDEPQDWESLGVACLQGGNHAQASLAFSRVLALHSRQFSSYR